MTYIVHASKGDIVRLTVRLRVIAAIDKAQSLSADGWSVVIIDHDDIHYPPTEFHKLKRCSES